MFKFRDNLTKLVRHFHVFKSKDARMGLRIKVFTREKLLGKYLFLTNTVSCGLLMGLGDNIQQKIEFYRKIHKEDAYNRTRTIHMTVVGLAIGAAQHFMYKYIDFILPLRTLKSVTKKIILDQVFVSPPIIYMFFGGLGLLEEGNLKNAHEELKKKFFAVYLIDWCVWPPTQYINFSYLPQKYRVVYVNFIALLYDIFLSYVKYQMGED